MNNLLSTYMDAMIRGDLTTCISIEQKYDLYGYPPEVVSVALKAIDDGGDHEAAIYALLCGCAQEDTPA